MASPYEVLRIDPDADDETVEDAYRRRVKEAHPDQGGSLAEFQAVRTAYEKLKAGYTEADEGGDGNEETTVQADDDAERDWYGRASSQVTYLDYDVLADHGWEVDDEDVFRKAAAADLDEADFGQFTVEPGETLLEAAEARGYAWPFACRGGACANCAILLLDGELSMPPNHVLTPELMERGFRLSCNGIPITDDVAFLYNVKHMPELEELLLPPRPFKQAHDDD